MEPWKPQKPRRSPPGGWKAFTEEVEKRAARARLGAKGHPNALANLKRTPIEKAHSAPACTAVARSTGQRCKRRAVRGADLCPKHGGLLLNPAHHGNRRALASGKLHDKLASIDARQAFHQFPPDTRATVHQAAETAQEGAQRRRRVPWQTLLEGAQALHSDQPALAFQRWLKALKSLNSNTAKG